MTGLGSGVATIAAGSFHTCVLTTGGGIKCWGTTTAANWETDALDRLTPVNVSGRGAVSCCHRRWWETHLCADGGG